MLCKRGFLGCTGLRIDFSALRGRYSDGRNIEFPAQLGIELAYWPPVGLSSRLARVSRRFTQTDG